MFCHFRQYHEEHIENHTTVSVSNKMAPAKPCFFTDLFKDFTSEDFINLGYFVTLCLAATFLTIGCELDSTWFVGGLYLISNVMFYVLKM